MSTTLLRRNLMDSAEAAEYLGFSEHTIRAWTKRRCVPYIKINGAVRFDRGQLDEWIKENSRKDIQNTTIMKWVSSKE